MCFRKQERAYVLHHIEHEPQANWRDKAAWTFK